MDVTPPSGLRFAYWLGAVFDGAMLVPLLLPAAAGALLGLDRFDPGSDYRYDKTHLVPFGEFIPAGFRWFTTLMNIPLGDFNRGPANPPQRDCANTCTISVCC